VFLPAGFAGFMVAGLFAAYRSTLETHLNWGTSYMVNDLYRRFISPERDERHYVLMGRIVTVVIMLFAIAATFALQNAQEAFHLLITIGAGTGLVYLLRWFWWRVNAWTEVAAMAASFVVSLTFFTMGKFGHPVDVDTALLVTVGFTTVVWLIVTFATPPVDAEKLVSFYNRVRPAGPGWARLRREHDLEASPDSLPQAFAAWIAGIAAIYCALFGTGEFIFGHLMQGTIFAAVCAVAVVALVRLTSTMFVAGPASDAAGPTL
jgi:Na+/proline symporter